MDGQSPTSEMGIHNSPPPEISKKEEDFLKEKNRGRSKSIFDPVYDSESLVEEVLRRTRHEKEKLATATSRRPHRLKPGTDPYIRIRIRTRI